MSKRVITALAASAVLLASMAVPLGASASSHREAPTIATDPTADNTDVYAFTSPDRQDSVTLIANYIPLENPAGGPNFYAFGDDVKYDVHVDNVGDAADHVVFTYQFHTSTVNGGTFLYNTGLMSFANGSYQNLNRPQTYTLTMTVNGTATVLGTNLLVPPDNVGPHSVGSAAAYDKLANASVASFSNGVKSFAGQRSESFFVDLGGVFDLLSINPAGGTNYLAGHNVHSLVTQVPKSLLEGPNGDHVIGVWATASRFATTNISPSTGLRAGSGNFVQVSRLGNPLVNEAVMSLALKDTFNAVPPTVDHTVPAVVQRVTDPELAALIAGLGIDPGAPQHGRTDLVTVFLTGIPGINKPNNGSQVPAEMLRLNMSTPVSTTNPNAANRLGVLGGQLDGFPNGRRLGDDVTDIELQAVDGILCQKGGALDTNCRSGFAGVPAGFGDGVNSADVAFQSCFPYLANPHGPNGSGGPVSSCPGVAFPPTSVAPSNDLLKFSGGLAVVVLVAIVISLGVQRRKSHA